MSHRRNNLFNQKESPSAKHQSIYAYMYIRTDILSHDDHVHCSVEAARVRNCALHRGSPRTENLSCEQKMAWPKCMRLTLLTVVRGTAQEFVCLLRHIQN